MQRIFPEIISNRRIAENIYEMKLRGDFTAVTNPGQFVELTVDGCYLRRPISVCDAENDVLTLVFKTVGKGTEKMSNMSVGKKVDMLVGLGNGYDISKSGERPLLVGGGIGVPPLWLLCRVRPQRPASGQAPHTRQTFVFQICCPHTAGISRFPWAKASGTGPGTPARRTG